MRTGDSASTRSDKNVSSLNELLRGEISAVETYDQAIAKFTDPQYRPLSNALTRIRDEHRQAVGLLTERVRAHGGTPSEGSGAWGTFTSLVTGTAKLFGPQTALAALKQGEEYGIKDGEEALRDDAVAPEVKDLIRDHILPQCQQHQRALDQMMSQIDTK